MKTDDQIIEEAFPNPCPWWLKASIESYLEYGKVSGSFVEALNKLSAQSSMEAEIERRANEKVEDWKKDLYDNLIDMVEHGDMEGVPVKVGDLMKFIGSQVKPKQAFKKKTSHKND